MRAPTFASCVGSLLIALLLGASQPACKRKTGPSEHYDRGSAIHQRLYVTLLDDAYLDPRMGEAIKELKQVEATSISHPLALELLGQIDKGSKGAKAAADLFVPGLASIDRILQMPIARALAALIAPGNVEVLLALASRPESVGRLVALFGLVDSTDRR